MASQRLADSRIVSCPLGREDGPIQRSTTTSVRAWRALHHVQYAKKAEDVDASMARQQIHRSFTSMTNSQRAHGPSAKSARHGMDR